MDSFGWYLIMFGAGSGVLSFLNYEFSLLMWIDTWGNGVAWLIRGAFILIGMALVQGEMSKRQDHQTEQARPVHQGPVS